jgi:hypothetical protein
MSQCTWASPDGQRCTASFGHLGGHITPVPEASRQRCLATEPGRPLYGCSLVPGHAGQHEAWDGHQVGPVGGCLSV